jgi:hypothetical protein
MSDQVDDWEDDEPRQNGTNRRGDDYNRNDRGSYGNSNQLKLRLFHRLKSLFLPFKN